MPPPVPPTTPTGAELPEVPVEDPDLPLLPMRMATTTATTTTAATIAPMTTGLGPPFGVTLAIFLEASGRIWWVSLSEKAVIIPLQGVNAMQHPHNTVAHANIAFAR